MQEKQKKRILFLPAPESIASQTGDSFTIDPDIPIPIEIPDDGTKANLEDISLEAIASGMLLVIAEGTAKKEWLDYYRDFVLAVRPGILGEFTNAAIVKAQSGEHDLALEILTMLRGLFPASPSVKLNRALVLEEKAIFLEQHEDPKTEEAFAAAEAAYEEALAAAPSLPKIYFDAGFFYFERKEFRKAKECLSLYRECADEEEDAAKRKKAKAAIKSIDEGFLADEDFVAAYELIKQGHDEEGVLRIHGYLKKHPGAWNGWFVLGWALRRMERWEDGAKAISQAIELGGSGSDVYNELAICLMESGDLKNARLSLEKALKDDSENVKLISNMGILALKNNNHSEAAAFFRTVLEIDPQDVIAKNFFSG
jgi:Flp pilus assembly protein TadD